MTSQGYIGRSPGAEREGGELVSDGAGMTLTRETNNETQPAGISSDRNTNENENRVRMDNLIQEARVSSDRSEDIDSADRATEKSGDLGMVVGESNTGRAEIQPEQPTDIITSN